MQLKLPLRVFSQPTQALSVALPKILSMGGRSVGSGKRLLATESAGEIPNNMLAPLFDRNNGSDQEAHAGIPRLRAMAQGKEGKEALGSYLKYEHLIFV